MVRVMVARDGRHAHRLDSSGISLTAAITLQVIGIFPRSENGGVILGAIAEHEDLVHNIAAGDRSRWRDRYHRLECSTCIRCQPCTGSADAARRFI